MTEKWVVFDVMGLIFEVGDDTNDLLVPYIRNLDNNITSEQINDLYSEASLGKITSLQFWTSLGFGAVYPEVEIKYLDQCLTLDKEFIGVAEKLKDRYSLALLSNDVGEWSFYLRQKYGLDRLFKQVIISGDVCYRKPSPKIYKIFLEKSGCCASDCVFIDDRHKNLVPAGELGMKVIKFSREGISEGKYKGIEIQSFVQLPGVLEKLF